MGHRHGGQAQKGLPLPRVVGNCSAPVMPNSVHGACAETPDKRHNILRDGSGEVATSRIELAYTREASGISHDSRVRAQELVLKDPALSGKPCRHNTTGPDPVPAPKR